MMLGANGEDPVSTLAKMKREEEALKGLEDMIEKEMTRLQVEESLLMDAVAPPQGRSKAEVKRDLDAALEEARKVLPEHTNDLRRSLEALLSTSNVLSPTVAPPQPRYTVPGR